ncbi:metaxin-2-like [Oscarella lobularis]|uniref:metaxin-2-like n=1 Tax=Oscarella lobularis TaxID=121494 RepID=UPI0033132DAF
MAEGNELIEFYEPSEDLILPVDLSQCRAAKAYLKTCGIRIQVKEVKNAEFMSVSGQFPLLKTDSGPVEGFAQLLKFVSDRSQSSSRDLDERQKAQLEAYVTLVQETMSNAEIYLAWIHGNNSKITKQRYGCQFSFPLNHFLPWLKMREIRHTMKVSEWLTKTTTTVRDDVQRTLQSLESFLGADERFFSRSRGFSALECLIYGHFYSIERACQWLSPDNFLSDAIKRFRSLADIAKAVDAATFE